jgi:hypothetical protein
MDPLTLRYNNPGAVEFKPWMAQYGARLGPNGRYAQFDSPDQGYQVMGRVLDTYRDKHGLNTVTGIINRWAPANVDNNSTSSYAASVAKSLGIDPNAPLTPEQRPSLMRAMASYEAGRPAAALPAPMALGNPPAPAPAAAPSTGAPPMADPYRPQQRGGFLGLIDALQSGVSSPLFQSGAAMYSAASQGKDIGTGFLMGGEAAGRAAKSQAEQAQMQREMAAQRQRDQMWAQLTSGKTPAWASNLPAGTIELAKALGPESGLALVSKMALSKPEKTTTQKDYEYAKSQGFSGSLMDFTKAQNESKRPVTNIDMKGETSFSQEAGKATAKRYSELAEQGQAARVAQGDIDRLEELGAAIGTQGAVANVKAALGPYANALGVKIDGLDDIQAFSSIVSRLAPTMRPPGSGATSDFEFKQFLNALPQLAQTTEGRKLVLDQMRAMNAYKAQLGDLSERVLSGDIDRKTADAEIRKLGNPLTLWRQGTQAMPPSQPAPPPPQGAGRFAQPQTSPVGTMVDSVRQQIQSGQVQVPEVVNQARRAIQEGKDPARIKERLQQYGIDPASVGL